MCYQHTFNWLPHLLYHCITYQSYKYMKFQLCLRTITMQQSANTFLLTFLLRKINMSNTVYNIEDSYILFTSMNLNLYLSILKKKSDLGFNFISIIIHIWRQISLLCCSFRVFPLKVSLKSLKLTNSSYSADELTGLPS